MEPEGLGLITISTKELYKVIIHYMLLFCVSYGFTL